MILLNLLKRNDPDMLELEKNSCFQQPRWMTIYFLNIFDDRCFHQNLSCGVHSMDFQNQKLSNVCFHEVKFNDIELHHMWGHIRTMEIKKYTNSLRHPHRSSKQTTIIMMHTISLLKGNRKLEIEPFHLHSLIKICWKKNNPTEPSQMVCWN
jgi:hypothetical protein